MRRGTTPTLIFTTPYPADLIEGGTIIFAQRGIVFMEKHIGDPEVEVCDYVVKVTLTREETLAMTEVDKLKMQLDLDLKSGKNAVSNILREPVGEHLKGGGF